MRFRALSGYQIWFHMWIDTNFGQQSFIFYFWNLKPWRELLLNCMICRNNSNSTDAHTNKDMLDALTWNIKVVLHDNSQMKMIMHYSKYFYMIHWNMLHDILCYSTEQHLHNLYCVGTINPDEALSPDRAHWNTLNENKSQYYWSCLFLLTKKWIYFIGKFQFLRLQIILL